MNCMQWLSPADHFKLLPQPRLYLHYSSNTTVESIITKVEERNYDKTYDIALWRYKTEYPIVKLYHGRIHKEIRQGVYINMFVERMQRLLQEMEQLTIYQALYLIRTSLIALERLCQKFGYFQLSDRMIGVNRNNECKVWINQNLEQSHILRKQTKQSTMVDRLFQLVEVHTQRSYQSRSFFSKASYQCPTFIKALNFINVYAYQQEIIIPPILIKNDRRMSVQLYNPIKQEIANLGYESFINNQKLFSSGRFIKNEVSKTQRKINNHITENLKPKNSGQVTLKCTRNQSNPNKPFNTSSLKQSKFTMAASSENASKKDKKHGVLSKLPKQSSISIMHHQTSYHQVTQQQQKKLTIMSTINLTIEGVKQPNIKDSDKDSKQIIRNLFNDAFQKNQWKKTVSHLFSSDKNLKQSMSYGQEEKLYLRDLNLKKLGQFGRFIKTSLLERNEDQQNQIVSQFNEMQK